MLANITALPGEARWDLLHTSASRWRIILPWQLEGSILEFYIHSPSEFWRPGSRLLLKKEGIVVLIVVFQLGC